MSNNEQLAYDLLRSFDIAVLERIGALEYRMIGFAPDFYSGIFPPQDGKPCTTPWKHSYMLEFFIDDAEMFFERGQPGELSSGVWQEDGKVTDAMALVAIATYINNTPILVIRLLQEDYRERVGILRQARSQLLENRELSQNLKIFKARSEYDGLTGIFNRTTFLELLQEEMRKSITDKSPLSLLIMDIDNFKTVNDIYGHVVGDAVLRNMGALLSEKLREGDIAARYGGEEFVVLIPGATQEHAFRSGETIRERIEQSEYENLPRITVSMGCSAYQFGETAMQFIERADLALYDAKHSGKNTVRMR